MSGHYLVFKDSNKLSKSEIQKVKNVQRGIGVDPDGYMGPFTLDVMNRFWGSPKLPYSMRAYGAYLMYATAENINILEPNSKSTKHFHNSFSGTFSYYKKPVSITIFDGKVINGSACHAWLGNCESVMYFDNDIIRMKRVKYADELPINSIKWAIGGLGLVKDGDYSYYDNEIEGFVGKYSDVLRKANHNVIFTDKWGYVCLAYFRNKSTKQIIAKLKKLGAVNAVQLDGGSWASVNTDDFKTNVNHAQYSIIQLKEV